jgi:hypothetical protein
MILEPRQRRGVESAQGFVEIVPYHQTLEVRTPLFKKDSELLPAGVPSSDEAQLEVR